MGKLFKLIRKSFWKYLNILDGVGLVWMHRFGLFQADSHPIEILEGFQTSSIAQSDSNIKTVLGNFGES